MKVKPDDKLFNQQVITTPMSSPGEKWWVLRNAAASLLVCGDAILVFSTEALAERFMKTNAGVKDHHADEMVWQHLVNDFQSQCSEVALDWKGPKKGWYKHGGRYALK